MADEAFFPGRPQPHLPSLIPLFPSETPLVPQCLTFSLWLYLSLSETSITHSKGTPLPTPGRWSHYFLTPNSVHTSDRLALHYLYTVTSPPGKSISKVEPKASSYFYPQCPPQAGTLEDMEKHVLHGWLTSHVESNHLPSSLFFFPPSGLRLSGVLKVKTTFSFISWVLLQISCLKYLKFVM